jgi:hypothetical protein
MIHDIEINISNLEHQFELLGVMAKIEKLQRRRADLMAAYEKHGSDKTLQLVDIVDEDIAFLKNIVYFFSIQIKAAKHRFECYLKTAELFNKTNEMAEIIQMQSDQIVDDMEVMEVMSDSTYAIYREKGLTNDRMNEALQSLRYKVKDFKEAIDKRIEKLHEQD